MGQLFSSEDERSQAQDVIGGVLYRAMLEAGAVPNLRVVHPLLLTSDSEGPSVQEQMQQLQKDFGNKAPSYLKDLIGRLSVFTEEPRLAGLLGSVVAIVIDLAYASSKQPSGRASGSTARQRVGELQELMEEYLKRCRINLSDKSKLMQDTSRLEAQLSLNLTQLKACLLRGDCDSRSLRQWASAAAFHTQMLVHLSGLQGQMEPLAARAAVQQYREDLAQIIPVYRKYKWSTVSVVKCRGSLSESGDVPEEGAMTGLAVTDRETGATVTIPLSDLERLSGRRKDVSVSDEACSSVVNLDLVSSDLYAQSYLSHLFSHRGPVAALQTYFTQTADALSSLTAGPRDPPGREGAGHEEVGGQRAAGTPAPGTDTPQNESLKLSIVETRAEST